jgi:hypothetical protein
MRDDKEIQRRVLWRVLGSPLVVGPFMIGMTTLTATWALDWNPGIGVFAALAGTRTSAGMFLTRLLVGGEGVARRITEDALRREQQTRQQSLDALDRQLTEADKDPRPETALRDLRALVKAFEDFEGGASVVQLPTVVELRARVNQLFEQCVQSLEQSGRLWQTAQRLHTPAARQPLLGQRERIIEDVQATVKQISETLVGLQTLGTSHSSSRELTRLREELDQSLAVAKTVEDRVNTLLNDADGRMPALPPRIETKNQE